MNNDISIRPSYLGGLDSKDAFAETIGFVTSPRIAMDNGFNVLDENGEPVIPRVSADLKVIMLRENDTRIFYEVDEHGKSTYDPKDKTPPLCYSDNRVTPSDGALEPQSILCANCPQAERKYPGYLGKTLVSACKDRYKVACLVSGAGGKVFLLDIGSASRKAYANYRNFLKQHHAQPFHVITKLNYAQNMFQFDFFEWLDPRQVEFVSKMMATDEPSMIVNAFDKPRQMALPQPEAPKAAPTIQEWAALPVNVAEPERQVEPPKRRGRPPKTAGEMWQESKQPVASAASSTPPWSEPAPKGNGDYRQGVTNAGFGMQAPEPMPDDMQARLAEAFGPKSR